MSRYIDADALKEWLDEYLSVFKKYDKGTIKGFVDHAPSIDIVRCKECRHWCCHNDVDYDQSKFTYYCEVHGISLEGDNFCSYGEREGE